jgi:hypothetical protein
MVCWAFAQLVVFSNLYHVPSDIHSQIRESAFTCARIRRDGLQPQRNGFRPRRLQFNAYRLPAGYPADPYVEVDIVLLNPYRAALLYVA